VSLQFRINEGKKTFEQYAKTHGPYIGKYDLYSHQQNLKAEKRIQYLLNQEKAILLHATHHFPADLMPLIF